MNYKLWIEGEAKGPCTLQDLRAMWEEGDIDGETLYAGEGSEEYKPLSGLAGILNIATPVSAQAPVSAPAAPAPLQKTDDPEVKTYRRPIPVLVTYAIGAFAVVLGLIFNKAIEDNYSDQGFHLNVICSGVAILFTGYLYDLIAQCLFELKEANRLRRKK